MDKAKIVHFSFCDAPFNFLISRNNINQNLNIL